jgi:hypothetical protein
MLSDEEKKKQVKKDIPKSVFSCVFTNLIFFSLFVFHSLIKWLVWISSFYSCNKVLKVVMFSSVLIIIFFLISKRNIINERKTQ